MASLLNALPAATQPFSAEPSMSKMTFTSAPAASTVQAVTLAYLPSPSQFISSTFVAGSGVASAGAVLTVSVLTAPGQSENLQLFALTGAVPEGADPLPDVAGLDAGSFAAPKLQLPDTAPGSAKGASNPLSPTLAQQLPAANLALGLSAGAQTAPALITPSVASTLLSQALDLPSAAFRISRTPADASPLQVSFVQTAYGPTDAVAQEGTASFVPGSANVDIPLAWALEEPANAREIVTLTLRPVNAGGYRVAQPTATLFLVDAIRGCSETALFEAFRRGQSTEAFNALFQLHRSAVFRTCLGLLGNLADAEDVTQVVFLMLARQQLRLGLNMAGWLRAVARHASIGLLRSRSRRLRHEKNAAKAEQVQGEDEATDLRDELEVALAQLGPDLRDAVRLRYLEGWSQQQAAERLGCPRGTLSQRAARGIQTLRDILGSTAE